MNNEDLRDLVNEIWDKLENLEKTPLYSLQAKIKNIQYDIEDLYEEVNERIGDEN